MPETYTISEFKKKYAPLWSHATIYERAKTLALCTKKDLHLPAGPKNPFLMTEENAEILKLSLDESTLGPQPRKKKAKAKPEQSKPAKAPPAPAAVPNASAPSWAEFEACCRRLALMCKQLRVSLVEIDTPADNSNQKVKVQQSNEFEVKL